MLNKPSLLYICILLENNPKDVVPCCSCDCHMQGSEEEVNHRDASTGLGEGRREKVGYKDSPAPKKYVYQIFNFFYLFIVGTVDRVVHGFVLVVALFAVAVWGTKSSTTQHL